MNGTTCASTIPPICIVPTTNTTVAIESTIGTS